MQAWLDGRTGYPLVDACMRALHAHGWINFRMRCMLVSFASYDLWLSWKCFSPALAQLFLDYEPGIHYPQLQMQSGTTGINTNRMYDPNKQILDHDPQGIFIKKYVPELKHVDPKLFHKPWKIDVPSYPKPIVSHAQAIREAHKYLREFNHRVKNETRESADVFEKHGSRKPTGRSGMAAVKLDRGIEALALQEDSHYRSGPLRAERASSGRSSCRVCSERIEKNDLRCGLDGYYRGRAEIRWVHASCFISSCLSAKYSKSTKGKCCTSGIPFGKGDIVLQITIGKEPKNISTEALVPLVQLLHQSIAPTTLATIMKDWQSSALGLETSSSTAPLAALSKEDQKAVLDIIFPVNTQTPLAKPEPLHRDQDQSGNEVVDD